MSNLFIGLYLDEDVNVLVAALLRAHGFDALTTQEAGRLAASDVEQLAYAASHQRALLSHNRADYEK
jgi:predicted nuclease of predicted toxin-antitoxin system